MFSCRVNDQIELRSLQMADADELFQLTQANRAFLRQWLPWIDNTREPADTLTFIGATLEQVVQNQGFVAAIRHQGAIVGVIGYNRIDWQNRTGHIGYWLVPAHQGRGIMTLACQQIIHHSFTELKLERLIIACASENYRSRAIPERLGFQHEGTTRQAEWLYDHWVDHEIYALGRDAWKPSSPVHNLIRSGDQNWMMG